MWRRRCDLGSAIILVSSDSLWAALRNRFFFNSVPFPSYPSCSTPLCLLAITIGSLCGLKGTRYSVAEFTPPFCPQFRTFLSTPSPFAVLALSFLFPPAFYVKKDGREVLSSSLLSIFIRFSYTRDATHLVHNKHTRG